MSTEGEFVLGILIDYIANAGEKLVSALSEEERQRVSEKIDESIADLEQLASFIEKHPDEVSVTLNRTKINEARGHLNDVLNVLSEASRTLEARYQDRVFKKLRYARDILRRTG